MIINNGFMGTSWWGRTSPFMSGRDEAHCFWKIRKYFRYNKKKVVVEVRSAALFGECLNSTCDIEENKRQRHARRDIAISTCDIGDPPSRAPHLPDCHRAAGF